MSQPDELLGRRLAASRHVPEAATVEAWGVPPLLPRSQAPQPFPASPVLAKRLAATYDPNGSYYPDIDLAVRKLRELAGWNVDLLDDATPPPSEDEPEWRSLLDLARLTAAAPTTADRLARLASEVAAITAKVRAGTGRVEEGIRALS